MVKATSHSAAADKLETCRVDLEVALLLSYMSTDGNEASICMTALGDVGSLDNAKDAGMDVLPEGLSSRHTASYF